MPFGEGFVRVLHVVQAFPVFVLALVLVAIPARYFAGPVRFGEHYRQIAKPFHWTFTRADLDRLLAKIETHEPYLALTA